MKALTLHQPWASLIALGVKTIETRPRPTRHRGPLAIHAGATMPSYDERYVQGVSLFHANEHCGGWWAMSLHGDAARLARDAGWPGLHRHGPQAPPVGGDYYCPRGVVVATCTLVDVVPTAELWWSHTWPDEKPGWRRYVERSGIDHVETVYADDDQRPYGDFAPGRYAWLLADVVALPEPVPAKGRQGLWEWEWEWDGIALDEIGVGR